MAKLSDDQKYVTVEAGDTLSQIAEDFGNGLSYRQLASINDIHDPDYIYVGQKIYLTGAPEKSDNSNIFSAYITHFGLQSNSDSTLFAVWSFNNNQTEHYETEWYYDTGDGVWFVGNKSTTEDSQSTYSIPSNAIKVFFRVKPISKTHTVNEKEVNYWKAQWSDKKYYTVVKEIGTPSDPKVELNKQTLKITASLTNISTDIVGTHIEFQLYERNRNISNKSLPTVKCRIDTTTRSASATWGVSVGKEYMVRCRAYKNKQYGDWSGWSDYIMTPPEAPERISTLYALSETDVHIGWIAVKNAETYEVEYTTELKYFDSSPGNVQSVSVDATKTNHTEITGLETGKTYYFRVRAKNSSDGDSAWTETKSLAIGKKPAAPTTWTSTSTVIVGEPLIFYWIHNSQDGSKQKYAEIEITIGDKTNTYTIDKTDVPEDEADNTSTYTIDTTYSEGTVIKWRVRTSGVTNEFGAWSTTRTINVYATPVLSMIVTNGSGRDIDTLTAYPLYIKAIATPETQTPLTYYLAIVANESYASIDDIGNSIIVNEGDEVYSKNFDISDSLTVELSAEHVNLDNGINYTVRCIVSMDSGLTAESSKEFEVAWRDVGYAPNAEIIYDEENVVTYIRPYSEYNRTHQYQVDHYYDNGNDNHIYTTTDTEITAYDGVPIERMFWNVYGKIEHEFAHTETGEQVFSGKTATGTTIYYCNIVKTYLSENVSLSVYRREFDGTFTEIQSGIDNQKNTFVVDPHPSLDYARYRIVAKSDVTGTVSFYDIPGYPINEPSVIIQWDEAWSSFDTNSEDMLAEPSWNGSMLKIPYNVDVSDATSPDVAMVEYVGRQSPVSYYGTQIGETATWNVQIPKSDKDTIYALRRLSRWMGDVYVREPSGTGYWANITVSFNQKHCDVLVPVTFNIVRVEGGI